MPAAASEASAPGRQPLDDLHPQPAQGELAGAGEADDAAAEHQDVRMGHGLTAASSAKAASKASRVAAISASPWAVERNIAS